MSEVADATSYSHRETATARRIIACSASIDVAIVIPVYKHPGLIAETLVTALSQVTDFNYAIIIVNDGCPLAETDIVCMEFASRHPDKIRYVKKPNGGLSSARNAGIDHALAVFPNLQAIYLLDADNHIKTQTLQKSFDMLQAADDTVGWVYPDINKFGITEFASVGGRYSVLEHLCWNFCEAGSMIRTSVFREGLRYDESMRSGYEDWEFWLQCIGSGYTGLHLPASGFRYRQRAESMLKDSERQHANIVSYIRDKHKSLFSVRNLVALEREAGGRYTIYCTDSKKLYLATDTNEPFAEISLLDYIYRVSKAHQSPGFLDISPLVVFATEPALLVLKELKLLAGVLWELERRVGMGRIAATSIGFERADIPEVEFFFSGPAVDNGDMHLMMADSAWLVDQLRLAGGSETLDRHTASRFALQFRTTYELPVLASVADAPADFGRLIVDGCRIAPVYPRSTSSVQEQRRSLSNVRQYSYRVAEQTNVFPIAKGKHKDIGILLPVLSFGGVEKVALAYARAAHAKGARIHLFVSGQNKAILTNDIVDLATTISVFDFDQSRSHHADYFGVPLPSLEGQPDTEGAVGLLCLMDAVINFNVAAFNGVMARLKKMGVKTLTSQHLVDITPFGQPQGTPHQILAYEHAYDTIIVISQQLQRWFESMGVPREKLLLVSNGPGFPLTRQRRNAVAQAREARPQGKLRVLFMGRFDRQKGLDRLAEIVTRCEAIGLPIDWRLVGRPVLEDGSIDMRPLSAFVWPPAIGPKALTEHYGWADVLILPSRFEGVPLSIIEAGMLGCVPLATDVGAVSEIVSDGSTGLLIDSRLPDGQIVDQFVDRLSALVSGRLWRPALGRNAFEQFSQFDWENNTRQLCEKMGL